MQVKMSAIQQDIERTSVSRISVFQEGEVDSEGQHLTSGLIHGISERTGMGRSG